MTTSTSTNEKKNLGKGNSPSKMESFPSSVASLLALLSSPADSAFFIHPCSFPSDYPFINLCAVAIAEQRAKVKRERWTRKIFAVGEAKARTREKKGHSLQQSNRTHLN
jgi:hypothetical protein